MSDYDNTNSGVMFQPYPDQALIGSGKLNVNGTDGRMVVIKQPLKNGGDPVLVVYQQVGILFPNDKKGNDKAPDYSGPGPSDDLRIAGWRGEKDGKKYLSLRISEKQPAVNMDSEPELPNDDISDIGSEAPW